VVNDNMATATRIHIAERGRDPRRYELIAFGGAGPVHAYELARVLKLGRLVAPLRAGALSALGFLAAPLALDLVQAYVSRLDRLDWEHLNRLYEELERRAVELLLRAGARREDIRLDRAADFRYVGQGHEVLVSVPGGTLDGASAGTLREAFYDNYRRLYDRHLTDVPVEALNWRLRATTPAPVVDVAFSDGGTRRGPGTEDGSRLAPSVLRPPSAQKGERPVYFKSAGGFVPTAVVDRYALRPGDRLDGPAVLEERESTLVIGPGGRAEVDEYLNVIVEIVAEG
ncbi:MAG: hydantoinase/oxoprolinase family protein, partial [Chloroflexi bacterium]|nr:hydantoinase/oxoprolinase family protein [Chloroflexota bacterium]